LITSRKSGIADILRKWGKSEWGLFLFPGQHH